LITVLGIKVLEVKVLGATTGCPTFPFQSNDWSAAVAPGDCCDLFELQYLANVCKRVEDEKLQRRLYVSRVRQTEVLLVLLHTFCSGAAFLLPCVVIHATQVSATGLLVVSLTLHV
jgi:hypothetical protein